MSPVALEYFMIHGRRMSDELFEIEVTVKNGKKLQGNHMGFSVSEDNVFSVIPVPQIIVNGKNLTSKSKARPLLDKIRELYGMGPLGQNELGKSSTTFEVPDLETLANARNVIVEFVNLKTYEGTPYFLSEESPDNTRRIYDTWIYRLHDKSNDQ